MAQAQLQPVVSNIQVGQRAGTKLVDITYTLTYSGGPVTVWVEVSNDGGRSYIVPAKTFSGHIGPGVSPGTNRAIVWNAEADVDGLLTEQMRVRINARSGNVPIPPAGMVLIPGGTFQMGEWVGGSSAGTLTIYLNAFFMDRYEVTGALWTEVRTWAVQNGYSNMTADWLEPSHPANNVTWYDVVRWCNARSEKEGLTPVYYTDTSQSNPCRSASLIPLTNAMVKWNANGYRLPTEAEWEKAARGGLSGKLYSWGSEALTGGMANWGGSSHPWSGVTPRTTPAGYYNGGQQGGGSDMANGYGLYDMIGNVREWCWDRGAAWSDLTGGNNPRGSDTGGSRIHRGGSWVNGNSIALRVYARVIDSNPSSAGGGDGFRCVRGL